MHEDVLLLHLSCIYVISHCSNYKTNMHHQILQTSLSVCMPMFKLYAFFGSAFNFVSCQCCDCVWVRFKHKNHLAKLKKRSCLGLKYLL